MTPRLPPKPANSTAEGAAPASVKTLKSHDDSDLAKVRDVRLAKPSANSMAASFFKFIGKMQ